MFQAGQGNYDRKTLTESDAESWGRIAVISLTIRRAAWYHSPAKKPAVEWLDLFHKSRGVAYQRQ
jgi:hypothetical protein